MGVVHLARRPGGERVALKVIRPGVVGDDESRARMAREVNSLIRIRSPRVAEIIDADPWGDVPYVATRYVPGYSLHDQVAQEGPLEGDELIWFARCLAEAIGAVHRVGVVHRDIKPSNILMEGRTPILIDFGLARLADDPRLTAQGWLLGTPGYLAPEILLGQDASPASDLHSWAATVAYAGTGRAPFGGGPSTAVMDRVRRGEHDLTGLPEEVAEVVHAGLDPEPRNRPTVAAILAWLDLDDPEAWVEETDHLEEPETQLVPLAPFPVTRPLDDAWPPPQLAVRANPAPAIPATLAVPIAPVEGYDDPWQAPRWPGQEWPQDPQGWPADSDLESWDEHGHEDDDEEADEVDFTDDPWSVPDEAEPAPRVGVALRLRRGVLLALLGAGVTAGVVNAPYVTLCALVTVVWLLRTLSHNASAAAERRQFRGAKWYDGMQTMAATPVHLFSSLPGTVALLVWAGGLAGVAALLCYAVLASATASLAAVGSAFCLGLWVGPGATRVRRAVAPVVRPFARHPAVWAITVVAAIAGLLFFVAGVGDGSVSWAPDSGPPWSR